MKKRIRRIRLKNLKEENGTTDISLSNYSKIVSKNYVPMALVHIADSEKPVFYTKVYFGKKRDNNKISYIYYFIFKGLTSGYMGEGSRGLLNVINDSLVNKTESIDTIINLSNREYLIYIFNKELPASYLVITTFNVEDDIDLIHERNRKFICNC